MIKKLVFFASLFLSIPIVAFGADCDQPADCETAIGCEVVSNFAKITKDYTINDLIADGILKNTPGACSNFNFEYGWNNFSVGDNLSVDWKKIKMITMDKFNYDPGSKNFTFLVTENAWYAIGGRATGIIVGSLVVAGATLCTMGTFGGCLAIGAGTPAIAATATTAAVEAAPLATWAAITWGAGATTAITAQNIAISSNELKVKKTWSDWKGCVNITDNGVTSTVSDLFTTDVVRPVFPELRGNNFAFNSSSGNLLFKNGSLFAMTADQKDKILAQTPKIADTGACDWHSWKLYLYPVRIFLQDIDAKGNWKFDMRQESDNVLLDS